MSGIEKEVVLKNVLTEFKRVFPEVRSSFLFNFKGEGAFGDLLKEEVARALQLVLKEANPVGGLGSLVVEAEEGKLLVLSLEDFYVGVVASREADLTRLGLVLPKVTGIVFRVIDGMKSEGEVEEEGRELLQVEVAEGFLARNVRIDGEVLERWSALFEGGKIIEVELSTSEKRVLCKVKDVDDFELRGKKIIRLPKGVAKTLGLKSGDVVRAVPATAISHGEFLVNKRVAERQEAEWQS